MCYIAHSGILFSNSLPLVPRNMNNEAFSREVEMLPETHRRGRTLVDAVDNIRDTGA